MRPAVVLVSCSFLALPGCCGFGIERVSMDEYVELLLAHEKAPLPVKTPWDTRNQTYAFEIGGEVRHVCLTPAERSRWPEFADHVTAVQEDRRLVEAAEWEVYLETRPGVVEARGEE